MLKCDACGRYTRREPGSSWAMRYEGSPGERLSPVFYGGVRTDGDVAENLRSVATATLAQLDRSLPAGMADRGMVLRLALWLERDGRPS